MQVLIGVLPTEVFIRKQRMCHGPQAFFVLLLSRRNPIWYPCFLQCHVLVSTFVSLGLFSDYSHDLYR